MKYLVIGSGGREHTIAWRLIHDGSADEVFVAPGNGGIDKKHRVNIAMDDFEGIHSFCMDNNIDMVVVGPEAPLVGGLVDFLEEKKIPVFGPSKKAALLEGSKLFAKSVMEKYGVPTCAHWDFKGREKLLHFVNEAKYPLVIKLDGLAAGKGVAIPENRVEAVEFINSNVKDDTPVFVEEFFDGEEASVLGISDGDRIYPFVAAQDHKRVSDGDAGPNTGGMGAYAPAPVVTDEILERVKKEVLQPVVDGMRKDGTPFKGILYAGLMIKGDEIKVLEFNVRFGDPECQVILPLLEGRLGDIFQAAAEGNLDKAPFTNSDKHAITVVMASEGYPGSYEKGREILGLGDVNDEVLVFHAGTKEENGVFLTNGGRVLSVTAIGDSLSDARDKVYREMQKIRFAGAHYRKDIAYRALG